jgi:hypothetical protein
MSQYDIFKILVDELNSINRELSDCQGYYIPFYEYKIRYLKNGGWEVYDDYDQRRTYSQQELIDIIKEKSKLFQYYPNYKCKNYRHKKVNKSFSFKMKIKFYIFKIKRLTSNLWLRVKNNAKLCRTKRIS